MNYRDLFIRCSVIVLASIVLTLTSQKNQFDIHFKVRKAQSFSDEIRILNIDDSESTEKTIENLISKGVKHIFVSQFYSEIQHPKVTIFTIDELNNQYLSLSLKPDYDGIIRKLHLLANPASDVINNHGQTVFNINYRGNHDSFESLNFRHIDIDESNFENKIVILNGSETPMSYTTPLGLLTESDMIANILDNFIEQRFIKNESLLIQYCVLSIALLITLLLLIYLPSTLALISTFIFVILYISLSLWFFDQFNVWTPLFTLIVQTILTFLLISNYKSVLNERTRWDLEKESLLFNEVEEMKTNFLSLFSHDLKTPLAKIMGLTETLLSKSTGLETTEDLEKIKTSALDLEKYIKRILKMSQVQSKQIALVKKTEDINILAEKAIEQNLFIANEKNITLVKKLTPLFMIEIDASLIQEVMINFIENAIKYSPKNTTVTIQSEEYKNYIKFSVIDQGNGIPKEIQENIWEKHFRLDTNETGYGLGLFLSRYVIGLHKGQVFLNSKENDGSEFGFILPIQEENK